MLQSLGKISLGVVMLIAAKNEIDQRHILASRDLGATSFETLNNILIPGIFPTILAVLFLNFTMVLSDFGPPIIIGGKFKMLATETYMTIFSSGDLGKAAAMGVLLIPPAIVAFTFYKKNMDNINNKSEGSKALGSGNNKFEAPVALKYFTGFITIYFLGIIILKYGTIFLTAISMNVSGKLIFTLDDIRKVKVSNLPAIMRSIYFAIVAGVVSSIVGILLSYYTHRRKILGMKYIEFISDFPYIIAGIFWGLGYIVAFKDEPFLITGSTGILILNTTFKHISVANKTTNAAFATIDTRIEDSSRNLGVPILQLLRQLYFPC